MICHQKTKDTPFSFLSSMLNANYNTSCDKKKSSILLEELNKEKFLKRKYSYEHINHIPVKDFGNLKIINILHKGLSSTICLCEWTIDRRQKLILPKYVTFINYHFFYNNVQIDTGDDESLINRENVLKRNKFLSTEIKKKPNESQKTSEERKKEDDSFRREVFHNMELDDENENENENKNKNALKKNGKDNNSNDIQTYQVVLKLKNKGKYYKPCEINVMRDEIEINKKLQHSNILQMLLCGEDENDIWGFFEYSIVGDLYSYIGFFILHEEAVKKIVSQILYSLYYLHINGIIHCDIKMQNILLFPSDSFNACENFCLNKKENIYTTKQIHLNTEKVFHPCIKDPEQNIEINTECKNDPPVDCVEHLQQTKSFNYCIKLCDFGLSLFCDFDKFHPSRGVRGSHGYIAPEIIKECDFNHKIDMWALGILTFVLLSGYYPFYPGSKFQELCFHERYWANVSSEAKDFIQLLLQMNPENRPNVIEAMHHPWTSDYFFIS